MLKTFIYFTLKKLTGSLNINYHLCDIFGVQWPEQKKITNFKT